MAAARRAVVREDDEPIPESGTVTVACKMPNGLVLRIFEMVESREPVMGGGYREVQVAQVVGEPVTINGNAVPFGKVPDHQIAGGFALTSGVDAQFFAMWMKQNAHSAVVRNGLVFAAGRHEDAAARGKERRDSRSGLEPIDPDNPPMKGIQKAEKREAA